MSKQVYSGIGGQAVIEGIMMKNGEKYSVAVRKPSGEISFFEAPIFKRNHFFLRLHGFRNEMLKSQCKFL